MNETTYSYHMFLFPFTWSVKNKKQLNNIEFAKIFESDSPENKWQRQHDQVMRKNDIITLTDSKRRSYYSTYQFFNEAGKNIVFDVDQNDIVSNFKVKESFLPPKNSQYVITLKNRDIKLDIKEVCLKIFNTGIAVFYINCENRQYRSVEEVKLINEYGRRVSLSFWPDTENGYKKCADKLSIERDQKVLFCDDFKSFIKAVNEEKKPVSLSYISTVIRGFLNENGRGIKFRAKRAENQNEIMISPVLDGKMYVSSCIVDKDVAYSMKESFQKEDNVFFEKQERNIAELINVDLEGCCPYANQRERRAFLEEHLYYPEFGGESSKLLGITEQACIKIIEPQMNAQGEFLNEYEIDYHNNIYNQIILIGIAQRMAITNFQQEIAKIAQGIELSGKKMNNERIQKIMELQERYVAFQSQFLLYEVTAQREGTYIYNQIQRTLHVLEENEALSSRLSSVYELANINQGYGFNKWALVLSLIAMVFSIVSAINEANTMGRVSVDSYSGYWVLGIETVICLIIIGFITKIKYKK